MKIKGTHLFWIFNVILFTISIFLIFNTFDLFPPRGFPDTYDYLQYNHIPFFSKDFFFSKATLEFFPRPFTIPLAYKIIMEFGDWNTIVAMQKVLHLLAAFTISVGVCSFIEKTWAKCILTFLIYLLFSWWNMVAWTCTLLSESMSMSLFFMWIGTFLIFFKHRKVFWLVLHILIALLFSFTRDSWPYMITLFYILFLGVSFFYSKKHLKYLSILVLYSVVVFFVQAETSQAGRRYMTPLINSILYRVIPNDEYTNWFAKHGMPCAEMLKENWKERPPYDENWLLYRDSNYSNFIKWASTDGKSTYTKFLITHPAYTFNIPSNDWNTIINARNLKYYYHDAPPLGYTKYVEPFFPMFPAGLSICFIILCTTLFFYKKEIITLLPAILVLIMLANILIVYNADCFEKPRHFFFTNIFLHFVGMVSFVLFLDKWRTFTPLNNFIAKVSGKIKVKK